MITCIHSPHKIHVRAYKLSWRIQETSRTSKHQRNSVTVLVPPGGSSSAARRFMEKTQKTCRFACCQRQYILSGKQYVWVCLFESHQGSSAPPGGFLEKSRKREIKQKVMFSQLKYGPKHIFIQYRNKTCNTNSPNLEFLRLK